MLPIGVVSVDKLSQSHALVFSWTTLSKNIRVSLKIQISSAIRQKGESQNGCIKKAKKAKFSEKKNFLPPDRT